MELLDNIADWALLVCVLMLSIRIGRLEGRRGEQLGPLDVVDFLDHHGVPSHHVARLTTTPDGFEILRLLVDENGAKYANEAGTAAASVLEVWDYGRPPSPRYDEFEVRD